MTVSRRDVHLLSAGGERGGLRLPDEQADRVVRVLNSSSAGRRSDTRLGTGAVIDGVPVPQIR